MTDANKVTKLNRKNQKIWREKICFNKVPNVGLCAAWKSRFKNELLILGAQEFV